MKKIKDIILYTIIVIFYSLVARAQSGLNEDKNLRDYTLDEVLVMMDKGGKELVIRHGEEMLGLIYLRKINKGMEDPTEPPLLKDKKTNLPVYRALKSGGEETIALINRTKYFRYPRPLRELEVIAYLLHEILGDKKAILLSEEKISAKNGYEKANWQQINDLLKDANLAKGHFYYSTDKNDRVLSAIIDKQNTNIKELFKEMQEADIDIMLENHYKFHKVLMATLRYHAEKGMWPDSHFSLLQSGFLEVPDICFVDSEKFIHTPKMKNGVDKNTEKDKVLYIEVPDTNYELQGFLDGSIEIKRP